MWTFIGIVAVFAVGYAASIFTWPRLRTWYSGAQGEIERLKERIRQIGGTS